MECSASPLVGFQLHPLEWQWCPGTFPSLLIQRLPVHFSFSNEWEGYISNILWIMSWFWTVHSCPHKSPLFHQIHHLHVSCFVQLWLDHQIERKLSGSSDLIQIAFLPDVFRSKVSVAIQSVQKQDGLRVILPLCSILKKVAHQAASIVRLRDP